MKNYLQKLAYDYEIKVDEFLATERGTKGISKIVGELRPGARAAWCYDDDIRWDPEIKDHPEHWPYLGFIIPFPETDGRSVMELEHVCVVVVDYPSEKENPVADWCVLACLLQEDLHQFHIFQNPS
jgi:hypothetical protein